MGRLSDRRRLGLYDRTVKGEGWKSLCLVGIHSEVEVHALLAWCGRLELTAVFDPSGRAAPFQDRAHQLTYAAVLGRLRTTAAVQPRFTLLEMTSAEAAEQLGEQRFNGVVLHGVPAVWLAEEGELWLKHVAPGGMLIGTGHTDPQVRAMLNEAAPGWRVWQADLWQLRVPEAAPEVAAGPIRPPVKRPARAAAR